MTKLKIGYKQAMGEIPIEIHEKIAWYNKISDKSLNVSRTIERYLTAEVKKIEAEAVEVIKKRDTTIVACGDERYNAVVSDIKAGMLAPEVYRRMIKGIPKYEFKDFSTSAYLPLLPVNKLDFNEEKQTVTFYVDDLAIYVLAPMAVCETLMHESVLHEQSIVKY